MDFPKNVNFPKTRIVDVFGAFLGLVGQTKFERVVRGANKIGQIIRGVNKIGSLLYVETK